MTEQPTPDVATVRRTWDDAAEAWDTYDEPLAAFTAPVTDRLLQLLAPGPEDRVLELACGTGPLGRAIARTAQHVTSTDIAPRMVAAARRRAEAAGLAITVETADAHDLPYDDGSFDAVVCQMAFMLLPRPLGALAECRRVLRPGGRLVFSTWGPAAGNPWVLAIGGALLRHGHPVPGDPLAPGGLFSLSDPAVIRDLMTNAGFDEVRTEEVAVSEAFPTFDAYWDHHVRTGGPIAAVTRRLDDGTLAEVRATCQEFCEPVRTGSGYELPGVALVTLTA